MYRLFSKRISLQYRRNFKHVSKWRACNIWRKAVSRWSYFVYSVEVIFRAIIIFFQTEKQIELTNNDAIDEAWEKREREREREIGIASGWREWKYKRWIVDRRRQCHAATEQLSCSRARVSVEWVRRDAAGRYAITERKRERERERDSVPVRARIYVSPLLCVAFARASGVCGRLPVCSHRSPLFSARNDQHSTT